jgi:hypothetical protein
MNTMFYKLQTLIREGAKEKLVRLWPNYHLLKGLTSMFIANTMNTDPENVLEIHETLSYHRCRGLLRQNCFREKSQVTLLRLSTQEHIEILFLVFCGYSVATAIV